MLARPAHSASNGPVDELAKLNIQRRQEVETQRDNLITQHGERQQPVAADYPLAQLRTRIREALRARSGRPELEPDIAVSARNEFGGDLVIKVPELLKQGGARPYISDHVPWIAEVLQGPDFADLVAEVATKGIYVNLKLSDRWLLDSLTPILSLAERYGEVDTQAARRVVVDYSSPNVAKVLHAGHIRSTIIGHVLGNLHQACGALVYRLNHINDFGGFGFSLEGYRRFAERFPSELTDNQRLLALYSLRRALERVAGGDTLSEADQATVAQYLPEATTPEAQTQAYREFEAASNERFERLEQGDPEEVALWSRMVQWSLADFETFYNALDIHIDFVLGESFYFQAGNELVQTWLNTGKAVTFTEAMLAAEVARLDELLAAEKITSAERDRGEEAAAKDVGAVVVPLRDGARLVILRADGRSIYATRDLGAIGVRRALFDPTDITYVVGQEQKVHFDRVFQAAEATGLATPAEITFKHLFFGFYVDAGTRKKLSSRDSVSNVNQLLTASVEHFRNRVGERGDHGPAELEEAATQLAIGSLVFNDLKQDVKGAVEIATGDLQKTIGDFEKSGGAYVVYTACRARSILTKHGGPVPAPQAISSFELNAQEAALILKLLCLPERLAAAAEQTDPVVLVRYLLDVASAYNPYYAKYPVLKDGEANQARLTLTKAVQQTLSNGLQHCHITCPPRI